jgi:hypothetical protein
MIPKRPFIFEDRYLHSNGPEQCGAAVNRPPVLPKFQLRSFGLQVVAVELVRHTYSDLASRGVHDEALVETD